MHEIGFDFGTDKLIRKSSEAFSCGSQYRRDGTMAHSQSEGWGTKEPTRVSIHGWAITASCRIARHEHQSVQV
jgi:hypothetical protein